MFESILGQDMEFHDQEKNRPSNLLRKVFELAHHCVGLSTNTIGSVCKLSGTLLFVLVFALIYLPQLCPVFLVFGAVAFTSLLTREKMDVNKKRLFSKGAERLLLTEIIENFHYVSGYALEDYLLEVFRFTADTKTATAIGFLLLKGLVIAFDSSVGLLLQFVVFKYGLESCQVVASARAG